MAVRLTLPPGVSSTFHENDMMLLSRDNPEVCLPLLFCPPGRPAICPPTPALPGHPCNKHTLSPIYPPSHTSHPCKWLHQLVCHRRSVAMRCTMPWESCRGTRGISPLECASGSPMQRRRGTSTACRGACVLVGCVWAGRDGRQESLHYPGAPLFPQVAACSGSLPAPPLDPLQLPDAHLLPATPLPPHPPRACRARAMRASIAKLGSHWYVLKLSSMSTIMREWAAIHCLAHMPLREVLLSGQVRRC